MSNSKPCKNIGTLTLPLVGGAEGWGGCPVPALIILGTLDKWRSIASDSTGAKLWAASANGLFGSSDFGVTWVRARGYPAEQSGN